VHDRQPGPKREQHQGHDGARTDAGVATAPTDGRTVATLFQIADDRLLAAKAAGKDRLVGASSQAA